MLNPEDRRAIEGLFDRLSAAERQAPERDPEAQELIDREIARQPGAPYYMAQTILVQQHALEVAERRIEELEQQSQERGRGGLFGGLFDDGRGRQNRYDDGDRQVQRQRSPWDRQDDAYNAGYQRGQFGGGGSFLGGAMQTALGVAGGVLLGSAIGSLLGAGGAHASEAANNDQAQDQGNDNADQQQDQGNDQDAGNDTGGDWGDFGGGDGGFDIGGDF